MNKRVIIDTTGKDIDEETQYTNWKSMIDSFSSYEIRFIAAVEPNFRYVNSKTRLLTQENNTIYAPELIPFVPFLNVCIKEFLSTSSNDGG